VEGLQKITQFLDSKVRFHSEECMMHTYQGENGRKIIKPVRKMIVDDQVICPRCVKEQSDRLLEEQANRHFQKIDRERKKNMLFKRSILENQSITESRLDTYETECEETARNKKLVLELVERIKSGEILNVFIVGVQGSGKSHLAYGMLYELVEYYWQLSDGEKHGDLSLYSNMKSCLYVEFETLIRLIKDSFRNKDSKFTEEYCIRLMIEADYLVIDDLGAESGSMNRDDEASNFIQRTLYAVSNGRQNKTTITTTNLGSQGLFKKYDPKLGSRLMSNAVPVIFKQTTDKRIAHLEF